MKNKNIAAIIASLAVALVGASAQTTTTPVTTSASPGAYYDAETMANGFLQHVTDHYRMYIDAQQLVGNAWQWISITAIARKDLAITNLSIGGTNVPLPKPLLGIPVPTNGYANMNINLYAVDASGQQGASGSYYTNVLFPGTPISITVEPAMPPLFVPGRVADPYSYTVTITDGDEAYWTYDSTRGGFIIGLGAYMSDAQFKITDPSGKPIAWDYVNAFQPTATPSSSTFGVQQIGNIIDATIGTNTWVSFDQQKFDCTVTRDGLPTVAKEFDIPNVGLKHLTVYVYGYSGNDPLVEIRQPESYQGPLQIVPTTSWTYGKGGGSGTYYQTTGYLDKAAVTVLPASTQDASSKFFIDIIAQ